MLVNGQVSEFIEDKQRWFEILFQAIFKLPGSLGSRQSVDHVNSGGKQDGVCVESYILLCRTRAVHLSKNRNRVSV